MKKFLFLLITLLFISNVHAQLAGTKWKTTLPAQPPIDVVFNFSSDSLNILNTDNYNLETLKYTATDSVLSLQKIHGQTGCDTSAIGTYNFKLNGRELTIKLIADACNEREQVLTSIIYPGWNNKIKTHFSMGCSCFLKMK